MASSSDRRGLIIEMIQNYEFLYDLQNKNYKNSSMKEEAWKEIGNTIELSVEECKKIWKAVRDKYTREKRETFKSESAAPESRWEYFDSMRFFEKCTKPRKTYTTTKAKQTYTNAENARAVPSCSAWSDINEILSPAVSEDSQEDALRHTEADLMVEAETTPVRNLTQGTPKLPSKRKRSIEDELVLVAKEITTGISTFRQQAVATTTNPNRTCVEYIYSELELLGPEEAKAKRAELLRVFFNNN